MTNDVRASIHSFTKLNFADVQKKFEFLECKDQLLFMVHLLQFVIPKKQNNQVEVSLSKHKKGNTIKFGAKEILL